MSQDRMVDEFAQGLKRLERRHGHFTWETSFSDLVVVIGELQLALRHPGNRGLSARRTWAIVNDWIELLGKTEPRVAELLRLGFDPAHDQPTGSTAS